MNRDIDLIEIITVANDENILLLSDRNVETMLLRGRFVLPLLGKFSFHAKRIIISEIKRKQFNYPWRENYSRAMLIKFDFLHIVFV